MVRLRHYDGFNTARAINFSCYRRLFLLRDRAEKELFITSLISARIKYRFSLLGYVIMPNHVHLVIHPKEESIVGKIIGEIKSQSGRKILSCWKKQGYKTVEKLLNPSGKYSFWQGRCYDHNCRTPEKVIEKINYCHNNPVKAGLVNEPGDWEWSSYNWYQGQSNVPLEINRVEE
jgi:putative transposase